MHAVRSGHLERFDVPEWYHGIPVRPLYVAPEFWSWVDDEDALHVVPRDGSRRTIYEQVEIMLADLRCAARPPGAHELRRLTPNKKGIWKLHPPGARLYGWFPAPGTFVLVSGATEADTKADKGRNASEVDKVEAFIRARGFGAFITLGDYRAVYPR